MLDPNFRRTVLFISAHDPEDGAVGVIINRPLDKNVAELVSETPPENLADVPVFFGGPVGNNQLMLAEFEWHKEEGLKLNQHSLDGDKWKVSSEPNNDFLSFYINNTLQAQISGEVDWQQRGYTIPSGIQVFKWTYSKNALSFACGVVRWAMGGRQRVEDEGNIVFLICDWWLVTSACSFYATLLFRYGLSS